MWLLTCCRTSWNLRFQKKDIDRSHRIRKPSPRKKRPTIVKFVPNNDRHKGNLNKNKIKRFQNFCN